MSLTCGAHAHTVIVDFFCRAAAMSEADAVVAVVDVLGELLEHAVAAVEMARPIAAATSARRRLPPERVAGIMGSPFLRGVGTGKRVERRRADWRSAALPR
jgi:hypothetical protein